jgi:hypothetical protein
MGVRSMSDEFLIGRATAQPERLRTLLAYLEDRDGKTTERMDSEDVGTLACMLTAASEYIEEQDEMDPVEVANKAAMQVIQAELIKLLNNEATEDEPPEPMEGMNSSEKTGEIRTDLVAEAAITEAEAGVPGAKPTPLYFGKTNSRKATPGRSSTSLYIPKSKKTRKGWNA